MTDLTEFLHARIAEDEAIWLRMSNFRDWYVAAAMKYRVVVRTAEHFRADCDAKRRIVEWGADRPVSGPHIVLRLLALPYASHPDYREEWRP